MTISFGRGAGFGPGAPAPFVVADSDGNIIYANDAAHEICAALISGENVFSIFPTLQFECRAARAEGRRVVRLRFPGEAIDTLTAELCGGLLRLYPNAQTIPAGPIYEEAAREFALTYPDPKNEARTRELYETLVSSGSAFLRSRAVSEHAFIMLLTGFFDSALPRMRNIGHRLVLTVDKTVTDESTVNTDIYSFHLMLSAVCAAVGYAAEGDVTVRASHTVTDAVLTVSAARRKGLPDGDETFFGPHTPDIMFAGSLAHASGCELSKSITESEVSVTLTIPASGYYPEWLKQPAAELLVAAESAEAAAELISSAE